MILSQCYTAVIINNSGVTHVIKIIFVEFTVMYGDILLFLGLRKSKKFKMEVAILSAAVSGISLLILFYERCREKNKPEWNKWSCISSLISCEKKIRKSTHLQMQRESDQEEKNINKQMGVGVGIQNSLIVAFWQYNVVLDYLSFSTQICVAWKSFQKNCHHRCYGLKI